MKTDTHTIGVVAGTLIGASGIALGATITYLLHTLTGTWYVGFIIGLATMGVLDRLGSPVETAIKRFQTTDSTQEGNN